MRHLSIKYVGDWFASIIVALFLAFPAHAETKTGDTWHFQLGTYGWLSGQKGTLATQPGLPAADVDIDFYDDIAGNINGAFSLIGEVRKGRLGVVADVNYSDIEDDEATPGPLFSALTSRTKTWIASMAGFYRLVEQGPCLSGRHGRAAILVRGFVSQTGGRHSARQGNFQQRGVGGPDHRTQGAHAPGCIQILHQRGIGFRGLRRGIGFHVGRPAQPGLPMDGDVFHDHRIPLSGRRL